jgi:hypothetical protein
VTARALQGMARVRSGQAPAWPLSSDRRRHRGSAVNGGRRPFPEETRSAIDGGGVPPHTKRAISGPEPGWGSCAFLVHAVIAQVATLESDAGDRTNRRTLSRGELSAVRASSQR